MNSNEIEHYIVLMLVAAGTGIATKYGIDGATLTAIATGAVAVVAAGVSIYNNTNMKKVPQASTAVQIDGKAQPIGATVTPGVVKVVG